MKLLKLFSMKRRTKLIMAALVLLSGLSFSYRAAAQCSLSLITAQHDCAPATSVLLRSDKSGKTICNYNWTWGDGTNSSDSTQVVSHNYSKAGNYKVSVTVTYCSGGSCTSTLAKNIVMFDPPTASMNLPNIFPNTSTQCFQKNGIRNNFKFTESSFPGSGGAPIVKWIWNFGDGDTSTLRNPSHGYQAPGTYTISLRVVDTNGCEGVQFKNTSIVVLKDIATKFTKNGATNCNSATYAFKNVTDTVNLHMVHYEWDFGDGSPIDSTDYDPTHPYGPGTYKVKLTIVNNLGCSATDSQLVTVDKFQILATFKDTLCWSDAANNGVTFTALPQPNVTFWQWNFGDPNSGNQNLANFAWTASHKFVGGPGGAPGGPGNYMVRFLMLNSNPNCGKNGQLDTCFLVHIKGPEVQMNLPAPPPFPANNYVPATPMPKSVFLAIQARHSSCDPQTVKYSIFSKNSTTPTPHKTYKYCNADTLKVYKDSATDCYGGHKQYFLDSIKLKPTDSTISYWIDSTETTYLWTNGINTIPVYKKGTPQPFYPSSGTVDINNTHDTNMVTCKLPNLVHFGQNSIKYRLQIQMDDNTFTNVLDPGGSFRDTCRWKNYPYSSDSLVYFWKFNDPSGKNCTSTVANTQKKTPVFQIDPITHVSKVWIDSTLDSLKTVALDIACGCTKKIYVKDTVFTRDCNFSTLADPYHYYKGLKGYPVSRCQNVNLRVVDTVANCADSTIYQLHQGTPQAYWDRSAYCRMTWEMQVTQLAPKGQPGPNGPPLIGFQMDNQPLECTGNNYHFRIDLDQTLPTCGATNWWVVFDSANVVKYTKCPTAPDSMVDYGFLGKPKVPLPYSPGKNGYPAGAPSSFWSAPPWSGDYWYEQGDSGCKTIGLVLQNGICFDTAWYHDYICFNKLVPDFNVINMDYPNGLFVGASPQIHGHICQRGFNEGVNVRITPYDENQKDVNNFKYTVQRENYFDNPTYNNPWGVWYYNLPFWPDSAVLNPFTTWNDSVNQVQYKVYYVDTPHLYIIVNQKGLPPHRTLLNFPLYQNEIDSLSLHHHVNIPTNDERSRFIGINCGVPYVTMYTDAAGPVSHKNTQVLNLVGAKDSLVLPYPGFYTMQSAVSNLQGCQAGAGYQLIYGHYAVFNANNDSIVCLGQRVTFNYYIRYWSTNCPTLPNGNPGPPGCLNGYDEVDPQYGGPIPNTIDFAPWDSANPTQYRKNLLKGLFVAPPTYQPEQLWWNFGDDAFFYKVPTGSKISHTYIKPGVYTVSMRSIDWRSCAVTTVRQNLIKVIQPIANFVLADPNDTLNYCAPKAIEYKDITTILGSRYTAKVVKKGAIVDSTYVVDSVLTHIWTPGDGSTITRTHVDTLIFDYQKNDTFTVGLTVQTNHGCSDTKTRLKYVKLVGPSPKFSPIGKLSGCAPLTVHLHLVSSPDAEYHIWHFGDTSVVVAHNPKETPNKQILTTNPPGDSITTLKYVAKRGTYRLSVSEVDTFHDLFGNTLPPCNADWPQLTDSLQYWVTIFPNSPEVISGPVNVCVNTTNKYVAQSGFGEYSKFTWNDGKKGSKDVVGTDSTNTITYTRADLAQVPKDSLGRGIFKITLKAQSDSGCFASASYTVHVEDSHADFDVDSSAKIASGSLKYTFINKSVHAVKYVWHWDDGTPDYTTTDSTEKVKHEFKTNDKMPDTLTEGLGKPVITYNVTLTTSSPLGCKDTITKQIEVLREYQHYNVFTPNGDKINDKFVPAVIGNTSYNIKIFNRWGQMVFQSNDSKNNWDGNVNGNASQPCPPGTYYYIWNITLVDGVQKSITGAVTLLRK